MANEALFYDPPGLLALPVQ